MGVHELVPSKLLLQRREACHANNIEFSLDKAVEGKLVVERMGALVDGAQVRVSVSPERLALLIHFGLHILGQEVCHCRMLAIFLGRVVRSFEFRRPLMSVLNCVFLEGPARFGISVIRVVCIGLFGGLGGLRIALQKLGPNVSVVAYASSEIMRRRRGWFVNGGLVLSNGDQCYKYQRM